MRKVQRIKKAGIRVCSYLLLVLAITTIGGLGACTQVDRSDSVPLEPIPIVETRTVVGVWEGLVVRTPADRRDDWATLRIQEDGTYHFEAFRTVGVFSGNGRFELQDGKLFTKSERGSISLQLQHHAGKDDLLLKAEGQTADGMKYSSLLTPKGERR